MEENRLKMYIIKADKQPVGFQNGEHAPYSHHNITLEKEDVIYSLSDGYQDQFGGPKGKKFMIKRLKQLIMDMQSKSMAEQKDLLDKTIEDWKAQPDENGIPIEQVDDILVIGVRI